MKNNPISLFPSLGMEKKEIGFKDDIERMRTAIIESLYKLEKGYGKYKWAISEQTGIPIDIITVLLKNLKHEGIVEIIMIVDEWNGRPKGSGYALTSNLKP